MWLGLDQVICFLFWSAQETLILSEGHLTDQSFSKDGLSYSCSQKWATDGVALSGIEASKRVIGEQLFNFVHLVDQRLPLPTQYVDVETENNSNLRNNNLL